MYVYKANKKQILLFLIRVQIYFSSLIALEVSKRNWDSLLVIFLLIFGTMMTSTWWILLSHLTEIL